MIALHLRVGITFLSRDKLNYQKILAKKKKK